MNRLIQTFVLTSLLVSTYGAAAQSVPFPPTVIVNGNVLTGSNGYYNTDHYNFNGAPSQINAALAITEGTALFGASGGYTTPPYVITEGYWTAGYWVPGYWIPGYWTEGYYENGFWENGYWEPAYYNNEGVLVPETWNNGTWNPGTWINGIWVEPVWVAEVWVDGYWVPEVWSSGNWVPFEWADSGTYLRFAFQMVNGTAIQAADAYGNPWAASPQTGIPAILVDGILWGFSAADVASGYDYYLSPAGDGYLWITRAFYGGYDPQLGAFSGTNSYGFFRDLGGSSVRLKARNGDGSYLTIGLPHYGPPSIWSDGLVFRFLTHDATNAVDVYQEETMGNIFVRASVVSGLATGTTLNGNFQTTPAGTFGAGTDGSPRPAGSLPHWGPPAIFVTNAKWRYRGSTATADYYGGERPGQALSIGANGAVSYTDRSLNFYDASGLYSGGVFQNLPVIIRGVTGTGAPWSSRPDNASYPAAITVNGQPWHYSSTASSPGHPTYLGPQSGQTLTINGTFAVIADPTTSTYRTGTYLDGKFTFTGSAVSVLRANADGTLVDPLLSTNSGEITGDLDVSGNSFTLGSWPSGNTSLNGFTLSFADLNARSELRFDASRAINDWLWRNAVQDGGTGTRLMMKLDSGSRLNLYPPTGGSTPKIVLDPGGVSEIHGVLRVQPGGDIPMFVPGN